MKRIYNIIKVSPAIFIAGIFLSSCIYDNGEDTEPQGESICVNTLAVDGTREASTAAEADNTFMVLFWENKDFLENASEGNQWFSPYLERLAPQPVTFYERSGFDTHYPYPETNAYIYATGYAPGNMLMQDDTESFRKIISNADVVNKARYDFLGCDVWSDVYKGSKEDQFAQDKNKLYFRHLAAKLIFYADRDRVTMENKQYVRNVRVTNLYMSIDGGKNYTSMFTPNEFEWKQLEADDFTSSYNKTIASVKLVEGNTGLGADSKPKAGYKAVSSIDFAGNDNSFVLEKGAVDRVPIRGMSIDSVYVCNEIKNGIVQKSDTEHIRLKMDISAEISFNKNFPLKNDSGSTTDDVTFTRTWTNVPLEAIYQVDAEGNITTTKIHEFKPGNEYRVYIHFNRSGVNLTAIEQPWNIGGVHYITIPGGEQTAE